MFKLWDHYRDDDNDDDDEDDFNQRLYPLKVPQYPPSFAHAVSSWTGQAATDQD